MRLAGKICLVTGGSSGIGLAIAEGFLREGARVAITGRNSERLAAVAAKLNAGSNLKTINLDQSTVAGCKQTVSETVAAFGGLDVLVNNAGVLLPSRFVDTTEEQYDQSMNVIVKGYYFMTQAAVPHMAKKKHGKVINVSSVAAFCYFPMASVYVAAKGAVEAMTKTLAGELGPMGIRINTLAPGNTVTPLNAHLMEMEAHVAWLRERQPIQKGDSAQPDDMTGAAVFLASHDSDFVTGSTLQVDGGWTIGFSRAAEAKTGNPEA